MTDRLSQDKRLVVLMVYWLGVWLSLCGAVAASARRLALAPVAPRVAALAHLAAAVGGSV